MEKKNSEKFTELMAIWSEMTPGERATPEKIHGYLHLALESDLTIEEIGKRGYDAIKRTGFFPKVNELFSEDEELLAQEDYQLVEHLTSEFLFTDFTQTGVSIIQRKLRESDKEYLIPMFQRFGIEIANRDNLTATRAQFLKAHKAETKKRQLSAPERKKIDKRIEKLTEGIGK